MQSILTLKNTLENFFCSQLVYKIQSVHKWSSSSETFSRCYIKRIHTLCCTHCKKKKISPNGAIHVGVNDILRVQSKLQQQSMKLFINVKSMELMRLFYPQLSLLVELMLKFWIILMNHWRSLQDEYLLFWKQWKYSTRSLFKDRLYLSEAGKCILANNFIYGINNYFLLNRRQNNQSWQRN